MQSKKAQLFIFPYAGGSIASFKRLTDLIDNRVDVITDEYSGRGTRAREPLADTFDNMLKDAAEFCLERRNEDLTYALMGYSMGCFLSYEILVNGMIPGKQIHYFISAEISPQIRRQELESVGNPSDEWLVDRARCLGGLDERLIGNKRFRDVYLKPMISDFRHLFEYRYHDYGKKIMTDTTCFYCQTDTPLMDVKKWEDLIDGSFDYYEMGNNHFFINQHYEEMAAIINSKLIL